jgi:hypothetical protein
VFAAHKVYFLTRDAFTPYAAFTRLQQRQQREGASISRIKLRHFLSCPKLLRSPARPNGSRFERR